MNVWTVLLHFLHPFTGHCPAPSCVCTLATWGQYSTERERQAARWMSKPRDTGDPKLFKIQTVGCTCFCFFSRHTNYCPAAKSNNANEARRFVLTWSKWRRSWSGSRAAALDGRDEGPPLYGVGTGKSIALKLKQYRLVLIRRAKSKRGALLYVSARQLPAW